MKAISNKGIEIMLNMDILRKKDFSEHVIKPSPQQERDHQLSSDGYTTRQPLHRRSLACAAVRRNPSHVIEEGRPVGQFLYADLRRDR